MKYEENDDAKKRKKINQPNNRQSIGLPLSLSLSSASSCCHIDSRKRSEKESESRRRKERKVGIPLDAHIQHNHRRCETSSCFSQEIERQWICIFCPLEYFIIDALSRLSSQEEAHVHSHACTSSCFDTLIQIDRSVCVYVLACFFTIDRSEH